MMNRQIIATCCLACCMMLTLSLSTMAQESYGGYTADDYEVPSYNVEEMEYDLADGTYPAYSVTIPGADVKSVAKRWKKWMKNYKAKVDEDDNTMIATQARLNMMTKKERATVYAKFKERENDVLFVSAYKMKDEFITPESNLEYAGDIKDLVNDFAVTFAEDAVAEELKNAEKELKGRENNLNKLKKERERYDDQIIKAEKAIADAKASIEDNLRSQGKVKDSIETQVGIVGKIKTNLAKFKKQN